MGLSLSTAPTNPSSASLQAARLGQSAQPQALLPGDPLFDTPPSMPICSVHHTQFTLPLTLHTIIIRKIIYFSQMLEMLIHSHGLLGLKTKMSSTSPGSTFSSCQVFWPKDGGGQESSASWKAPTTTVHLALQDCQMPTEESGFALHLPAWLVPSSQSSDLSSGSHALLDPSGKHAL
jgi:hypothetical protein